MTREQGTHTGGEWSFACDSYGKVQHSRKACVYTVVLDSEGAERLVNIAQRIENWKDAQLIACAPQLLEMLKHAACCKNDPAWRDSVNALIDKAEGESGWRR